MEQKHRRKRNTGPVWLILILLTAVFVASIVFLVIGISKLNKARRPAPQNDPVPMQTDLRPNPTVTDLPESTNEVTVTPPPVISETDTETGTETTDSASDLPSEDVPADVFSKEAWYLRLIGVKNPLPEDYMNSVTLVKVGVSQVDERIAPALKELLAAAKKDGIQLSMYSGYRSAETHAETYNKKVQEYIDAGKSEEEARQLALNSIAAPYTSEHNSGLCADILASDYRTMDDGFAATDAAQWMEEHAHEYGFILRYPEDKTSVTKMSYEPWHLRYVGKEAADVMWKESLCLEEFLKKYGK